MRPKTQVQQALMAGSFETVLTMGDRHPGQVIGALMNTLYSTDDILRWRAVECLGLLTGQIANTDPGRAREIIRRLFWSLNDESGGSGWAAPEAVGEIIRNQPELFQEFISILVSFQDDPALKKGIIWALGRIGERNRELVQGYIPMLYQLLDHPDRYQRGLALWALTKTGTDIPIDKRKTLKHDYNELTVYEHQQLSNYRIADLLG